MTSLLLIWFLNTKNVIRIAPEPIMIDAEVSAYSSDPNETDSTPYLTASQQRVREGIIACPAFLRFGQIVEINGRQYECQDLLNLRYRFKKNFDIWMASKEEALNFGRQQTIVKIYQ